MKKRIISALLFIFILTGCTILSGCPKDQKMTYQFNGARYEESGCVPRAFDAGNVCTQTSDCKYGCVVKDQDLEKQGCDPYEFQCNDRGIKCLGIQGICAEVPNYARHELVGNQTIVSHCDE